MKFLDCFKKFFSYFKRVKGPIEKAEEAKPLITETRNYLLIFAGVAVLFTVLGVLISGMSNAFMAIAMVAMFVAIYFGLMYTAIKRAAQRLQNLTCDKCGSKLGDIENTTYKEISREWKDIDNSNQAKSKLYVTVKFTCKCPKCGSVKSFNEKLCSGAIEVGNGSTRNNIVSTQSLVEDYLNGKIHA